MYFLTNFGVLFRIRLNRKKNECEKRKEKNALTEIRISFYSNFLRFHFTGGTSGVVENAAESHLLKKTTS